VQVLDGLADNLYLAAADRNLAALNILIAPLSFLTLKGLLRQSSWLAARTAWST